MTLAQKLYEAERNGSPPWSYEAMPPWEAMASGHRVREFYERIAEVATAALTGSDASVAAARASALADLARDLVAAVQAERADRKDFEFSTSEMQERKRRTTRLLAKMKAAIEEVP